MVTWLGPIWVLFLDFPSVCVVSPEVVVLWSILVIDFFNLCQFVFVNIVIIVCCTFSIKSHNLCHDLYSSIFYVSWCNLIPI